MPAPRTLDAVRVVATPAALDAHPFVRIAPDEGLWLDGQPPELDDPYAVIDNHPGLVAVELSPYELAAWMSREADWALAGEFGQGMVAGIPVKIFVRNDVALVITRASFGWDLEQRL